MSSKPRHDFGAVDVPTRRKMQSNKRSGTGFELEVRRALHRRGFRYRVDYPIQTSARSVRPDIVFTSKRLAIFLDGCFWHGCPEHGTNPFRNGEYWSAKIARNRERDAEQGARLSDSGWTVLRFWEHTAPDRIADAIEEGLLRASAGEAKPRA